MPRGDGTGALGTGPIGRGRGGCQSRGMGLGGGFGRGMRRGLGFADDSLASETLETKARCLEEQAANLRSLAQRNRTKD